MAEDFDDKYYYKFKGIADELAWLDRMASGPDGVEGMIRSEEKRKRVKALLVIINRHAQSIQSKMAPEFKAEF